MKKIITVWLVGFFILTVLYGCSGNSSVPTMTETMETKMEESVSEKEGAYPVTVVGTDGEEVFLETEPLRIISVGPNITEMIYSLGAQDKLVGRTEYCDYPSDVLSVDTIGTLYTPDIEKILSLEPDLVIVSTHFKEEAKEQLKEADVSVLVLYEEKEMDGVYQMITTLGTALNRKEMALEVVADMKKRVTAVEEKINGMPPVSVYYVVGFGDGGDYTAGGDTFIDGILTAAGGQNVAKKVSGWSFSVEQLLESDPEVILLSEADYSRFIETEPYSSLQAVQNKRVYTIDTNMLDRQCVRNAEAIETIATMLYPDLFQ